MVYSFSLISFIIIANHFLISILSASPSVDDKMLIAFMKGNQETKISEYSMQKYEAHLGILYLLRMIWKCDKIHTKFDEYERTECQKYRKYLDILYKYLYREYVGIRTVKPKFVFKQKIEIEGPLIYAVKCLVNISKFYFDSFWSQNYEYKLNELFIKYFKPILLNEKRLNYEAKLTFNEMILQLAIETTNKWHTNEGLDGIIQLNCAEKFEEILEENFKKSEEKAKKDKPWKRNAINDDKHKIIVGSKFDDEFKWTEDALFSEFVKGLAENSETFFRMAKEYSNYLSRIKEKNGKNCCFDDKRMISLKLYETNKMKVHLTQKYEARLGIMYMIRENYWQSYYIMNKLFDYDLEECQKHRKHLQILYEYLFRLYVQGKSVELAKKLPPIKPIFQMELISVVQILNDILKYFRDIAWNSKFNELNLENEDELNFEIKEEENWFCKSKQNLFEKINAPKNAEKKGKKIINFSNETEENNLRQEFEQKIKNLYENTKRKGKIGINN